MMSEIILCNGAFNFMHRAPRSIVYICGDHLHRLKCVVQGKTDFESHSPLSLSLSLSLSISLFIFVSPFRSHSFVRINKHVQRNFASINDTFENT